MSKTFNSGDRVRLLTLAGAGEQHKLRVGDVYTVKDGGTIITLQEDYPLGLWNSERFELVTQEHEFYVFRATDPYTKKAGLDKVFRRAGDYKPHSRLMDAVESARKKIAESELEDDQFVVMQVRRRFIKKTTRNTEYKEETY